MSDLEKRRLVKGVAIPEQVNIADSPRTGDADRARYIEHLNDCHATGYIGEEEREARVAIASGAPSQKLLHTLIDDLPPLPPTQEQLKQEAGDFLSRLERWSRQDLAHQVAVPVLTFAASALPVGPIQALPLGDALKVALTFTDVALVIALTIAAVVLVCAVTPAELKRRRGY